MFPQLFDVTAKKSLAAQQEPLRHHSDFMQNIIKGELNQNTDRFSQTKQHGVATRRWFNGKDHDHFIKMCNKDFNAKKKLFAASDMDEVHAEYLRDRELRERRLEEEKWKVIFMLEETLIDEKYKDIRLAAGDKALYESMFKMEPRKYISRPKFLTVMRLVYGFELANLDKVCDNKMLERLNMLYTSFDTNSRNEMDWRCFILMLEMVHDKQVTCKDHVNWGYALYSSNGSFDTSFEEPMRLGDVKDLFGTMVRTVHLSTMVELTDAAWTSVASRDSEAKALVKKAQRQKKSMDDLKISHRIFELLLNQPSLAPLFEHARSWGKKDPGTWTYKMEEQVSTELIQS